jgi:hypothetical protein
MWHTFVSILSDNGVLIEDVARLPEIGVIMTNKWRRLCEEPAGYALSPDCPRFSRR